MREKTHASREFGRTVGLVGLIKDVADFEPIIAIYRASHILRTPATRRQPCRSNPTCALGNRP